MPESGVPAHRAKFRLFGGFRLMHGNGAIVAIPSRRARGLLAYLALAADRAATRERLCGLLWGDRGEAQARASLRQCLLEVRDSLAVAGLDILDRGREAVALRQDVISTDVADVTAALEAGNSAALCGALETVGGARLLDDVDIGGLYRDWLDQSRSQLDRTIGLGVLRHLERLEAEREWRGARNLAEAYLRRDPLDEAVVAAAIRADIATGNTATAHRRYQILQSALAKEFGVPPAPATRDALASLSEAPEPPPLVNESSAPAAIASATTSVSAPTIPQVIVALFEAQVASEAAVRLAAALRDEVLAGLSRFYDLRVLTDRRPLDAVIGDLTLERAGAYALGATLRGTADGPRLIVQILKSGEGRLVWSERFSLPSFDSADQTDDIVAKVVAAVLPTIDADKHRFPSGPAADRNFTLNLLTRGLSERAHTFEEARNAAQSLEAMILANPQSTQAHLPLAVLYNTDFFLTRAGSTGPAERARALELVKVALARDRSNVHAYSVAGWCYLRRRQWDLAKIHLDQALALNPFHTRRLMEVGYGLLFLDELDASRALLNRCLLLNPSPHDDYFTDLGLLSLVRGEHELAESYFELGADPQIWCEIFRAINRQMAGHLFTDKARTAIERVRSIWPSSTPLTTDSLVQWISSHHPFRSSDVESRFTRAAAATFNAL